MLYPVFMSSHKPFTVPNFLTPVPLPARLVLERQELPLSSVDQYLINGALPPPKGPSICELQIAGDTLAVGRVLRRFGRWYFQVQSLTQGSQT